MTLTADCQPDSIIILSECLFAGRALLQSQDNRFSVKGIPFYQDWVKAGCALSNQTGLAREATTAECAKYQQAATGGHGSILKGYVMLGLR